MGTRRQPRAGQVLFGCDLLNAGLRLRRQVRIGGQKCVAHGVRALPREFELHLGGIRGHGRHRAAANHQSQAVRLVGFVAAGKVVQSEAQPHCCRERPAADQEGSRDVETTCKCERSGGCADDYPENQEQSDPRSSHDPGPVDGGLAGWRGAAAGAIARAAEVRPPVGSRAAEYLRRCSWENCLSVSPTCRDMKFCEQTPDAAEEARESRSR